ncbi:MAG: winged helix-turn-helix domain-containing protein [Actinomycetota bacterium]
MEQDGSGTDRPSTWTFLSNHSHVLICLARDPEARLIDIAEAVGIRERAVRRIIADLVESGYVERRRVGRRNSYDLHLDRPLRHQLELGHEVGELVGLLATPR